MSQLHKDDVRYAALARQDFVARQDFMAWLTLWPDKNYGWGLASFGEFADDADHNGAFLELCKAAGIDPEDLDETVDIFGAWDTERRENLAAAESARQADTDAG
jgi:hypothetical protein